FGPGVQRTAHVHDVIHELLQMLPCLPYGPAFSAVLAVPAAAVEKNQVRASRSSVRLVDAKEPLDGGAWSTGPLRVELLDAERGGLGCRFALHRAAGLLGFHRTRTLRGRGGPSAGDRRAPAFRSRQCYLSSFKEMPETGISVFVREVE